MKADLYLSGLVFVVVFLFMLIYNHRKIKKSKYDKLLFFAYPIAKFKLDKKKISYKRMNFELCLINSLTICFVIFAVLSIQLHRLWVYMIAFVIMFPLIYAVQEIYGRYLVKKGWGKR